VLFSYIIAYKIVTSYIPYWSVYGLHPLMPIKYVMFTFNGDHKYANLIKVLTSRLIELEKLQIDKLHAKETVGNQ
jgi:hypothetical protein